jgi:peroxiredoxin
LRQAVATAGRRAAAFALAVTVSIPLTFATGAAPEKRDAQNRQLTFSLRDTNGAPVDLQKFRGRVVLVNFFATWCEPCRDELPSLGRLVERTGDKAPVVIAVSVGEPLPRVARFLDKTPVNFPVLLDETRAVTKSWEVEMLPSTFVLDEELRLRLIVKGDHNWDDVDAAALPERLVAPSDSH